jgi:hypothetical protein
VTIDALKGIIPDYNKKRKRSKKVAPEFSS